MPPAHQTSTDGLNLLLFTVPQGILLQLGTVPLLLAVIGGKAAAQSLQSIGQASEELFRGDRLPILQFPEENNDLASPTR